jgi:hypothetical protein
MYGHVTFEIKSAYVEGIDAIVQKFLASFLSESKTTYFGDIAGSDVPKLGKYSFSDNGVDDFKIATSDEISRIVQVIQNDDAINNLPIEDRLKEVSLLDVVYDKISGGIFLSIRVSSNSTSQIVKLPVL